MVDEELKSKIGMLADMVRALTGSIKELGGRIEGLNATMKELQKREDLKKQLGRIGVKE